MNSSAIDPARLINSNQSNSSSPVAVVQNQSITTSNDLNVRLNQIRNQIFQSGNTNQEIIAAGLKLSGSRFTAFRSSLKDLIFPIMDKNVFKELMHSLIQQSDQEIVAKVLECINITTMKQMCLDSSQPNALERVIHIIEEGSKSLQLMISRDSEIAKKNAVPYTPGTIETLLNAMSFFSADHEPAGPYEASQTLQMYSVLFIAPFFLSSAIDDLVQADPPFNRLNFFWWTIIAMAAAYIFIKTYKLVRPIPVEVPPLRNYTAEALEGRFDPLLARDDIIDRIFTAWASSSRDTRLHPLIVGSAGVGKTALLLEIARRISMGLVPASAKAVMKNKKMFGCSAAVLLPSSSSPFDTDGKLDKVIKRLEQHKNGVVLALDEVHCFWLEKHASTFGEIAKGILDNGLRGFPFFIGATTPDDYNKYIAIDAQRARRFFVINLEPTNENQTKLILREMQRRFAPEFVISDLTYSSIYKQINEHPKLKKYFQPDISKRILTLTISRIRLKQEVSRFSITLQDKLNIRDNLLAEYIQTDIDNKTKVDNELKKLDEEIKTLKELNEKYECDKNKRREIQRDYVSSQNKIYSLVGELKIFKEKTTNFFGREVNNTELLAEKQKEFLFLYYLKIPALLKQINDLGNELSISSMEDEISKSIDEFIKSEESSTSSNDSRVVASTSDASPNESHTLSFYLDNARDLPSLDKQIAVGNQRYNVSYTYGEDGACALHAILGEKTNDKGYFYSNARSSFTDALKKQMAIIRSELNSVIGSYLSDFINKKSDHHSKYLKMIFDLIPPQISQKIALTFQTFYNEQQQQMKSHNDNINVLIEKTKKNGKIQELQKLLHCQPEVLDDVKVRLTFFSNDATKKDLIAYFAQDNSYHDALESFKKSDDNLQKLRNQIANLSLKSVETNENSFHEVYLKACLNKDYYFSDLDIGLIAKLFNKRVRIYNDFSINQSVVNEMGTTGPIVVIYHKGSHYSKCEEITQSKDNMNEKK